MNIGNASAFLLKFYQKCRVPCGNVIGNMLLEVNTVATRVALSPKNGGVLFFGNCPNIVVVGMAGGLDTI